MSTSNARPICWQVSYFIEGGDPVVTGEAWATYMMALEEMTRMMRSLPELTHAILKEKGADYAINLLGAKREGDGEIKFYDLEGKRHHPMHQRAIAVKEIGEAILYAIASAAGTLVYSVSRRLGEEMVPTRLGLYQGCTGEQAVDLAASDLQQSIRLVAAR